ncbi:hypothetical protein DPMN_011929 [Dreissena polymorpha]|uniref:C3H1-type domain-containing protein n=1 Tax=Dreissena polymorpha TaxID=45954 RepID=A0A9D4N723_DREPO|nr:hypothetical protein DPMN_011929 [Dreissena polymorpha]
MGWLRSMSKTDILEQMNKPWGRLNQELWLRATTLLAKSVQANQRVQNVCFKYNKPAGCSEQKCRYLHACKNFKKNSQEYICFLKKNSASVYAQSTLSSQGTTGAGAKTDNFRFHTSRK